MLLDPRDSHSGRGDATFLCIFSPWVFSLAHAAIGNISVCTPIRLQSTAPCSTRERLSPRNELNSAVPDATELSFLEPGSLVGLVPEPGSHRDLLSLRCSEPWFLC